MKCFFLIAGIFFLSNIVIAQKNEMEISFSVMGSSYVGNSEETNPYRIGPELSKGTAVNIASDFLV